MAVPILLIRGLVSWRVLAVVNALGVSDAVSSVIEEQSIRAKATFHALESASSGERIRTRWRAGRATSLVDLGKGTRRYGSAGSTTDGTFNSSRTHDNPNNG